MQSEINETLKRGVHAHKNGNYDKAEKLYSSILKKEPFHADANHNLGALVAKNRVEQALKLFKIAINSNPKVEQFWVSYISTLIIINDFETAKEILKIGLSKGLSKNKFLTLKQQLIDHNKSYLQTKLIEQFKNSYFPEAKKTAKAILLLNNDDLISWKVIAAVYQNEGNFEKALFASKQAVRIEPLDSESHNNLGVTFQKINNFKSAKSCFQKAVTLTPDYADAYFNLGNIYQILGKFDKAESNFRQALTLDPGNVNAYNNLGNVLQKIKKFEDAEINYNYAINLNPNFADVFFNLGNLLDTISRYEEAEASYRKAINLNPQNEIFYNNLGNTLSHNDKFEEAEKNYLQALRLNPNYAEAYSNLGHTYKLANKLDLSLSCYEKGFLLDKSIKHLFGSLFHMKMKLCIWDNFSEDINELNNKINNFENVIAPFPLQAIIDDPLLQLKATENFSKKEFPRNNTLPVIKPYLKHKKIRIGYFSSDFNNHPVSYLTSDLYKKHDRQKFEIHIFSFNSKKKDELNKKISSQVDFFHEVEYMSDKDVALLSRSLEIDIAIDLNGYTRGHRVGIFSLSVAPIQIGFVGFLGTMGINYFDYIISDKVIIPEEHKKFYSEKIIFLPNYQPNTSEFPLVDNNLNRTKLNIPVNKFVFSCFNNSYKITPCTFDSWARILLKVDNSVLVLFEQNEITKQNLQKEIMNRGVAKNRLIFTGYLPKPEYFARFKLVNLYLDTTPYNGGTTSSDALRMGLPVLTCIGKSFSSRLAASILKTLDLSEMITLNPSQYEERAIYLAKNPIELKKIKAKLDNNLLNTNLYNSTIYTKEIEKAYENIFKQQQLGLEKDDVYV